jgi:hypothetical protein
MRTLGWTAFCLGFDVIPIATILVFGSNASLASWHAVEWLVAVPAGVFCLLWWICLTSGVKRWLPERLGLLDWRVAGIIIATVLSIVLTLVGFAFDLHDANRGFVKDIFAAWLGSVAFFGLVGIVASVVSLANAAEASFDTRARVLVRGRTGDHIDDFIVRLRSTLAHYAESITRTVTVTDYRRDSEMYRLRVDVHTVIRSFVDDVETVYGTAFSYKPDFVPPSGEFHKLTRLTGVECNHSPIESVTDQEIRRDYKGRVPAGGACTVLATLDIWVKAGTEPLYFSLTRYSLSTTMIIDNQLPHDINIRSQWRGERETRETITRGDAPHSYQRRNLKQDRRVHTFIFEPPP